MDRGSASCQSREVTTKRGGREHHLVTASTRLNRNRRSGRASFGGPEESRPCDTSTRDEQ